AAAAVRSALGGRALAGVVNNAGVAIPAPLEHLPPDDLRRQLEVNVVGQLAVTQAFMPALRDACGRVVFIGSIGGRVASPMLGAYSASKFALEAIADALRRELRPWRMHVAIVEPATVATPIWEKGSAAGDDLLERMEPAARRAYADQ